MSPCIISKKTGDSDMILVKDGLTINLPSEQFVLIMCCKMRINVTQIKVKIAMYYFNNIYIYIERERERRKKSKKRNVERMKEREKENERKRISFFCSGWILHGL